MKVIYIPSFLKEVDFPKEKLLENLPSKKIALFSPLQHLHQLEKIKEFLESKGKKVICTEQILGCDFGKVKKIKEKADDFLYVGSGKFHPLGIALASKKPVIIFNPYSCTLGKISQEEVRRYRKKRKGAIAKAIDGKVFGILISTKPGQFSLHQAEKLKEKLKRKGKKVFLFAGDEISPERVLGFKVDVWINTACPRIVEDYFDKPILNPGEVEVIS